MNKRRTIHGIDPYAPGGIDALLAHHRLTFGDAVMSADAGDSGPAGEPAGTDTGAGTTDAGAAATDAPKADDSKPDAQAWDGKIESLPADVQRVIKDLRAEAAGNRTGKTAAEQQLAAIQKALNPDAKGNEKPDAEALTKALADRESDARQAKTELAVYRLAGKTADADALLDSRNFLAKIADIDPSDSKAITKAIEDAVAENPKLKTTQAAGKSGADFSGGSGESTKKAGNLTEALSQHYSRN